MKERLWEADTDPGTGTADHNVWARHDRDREDWLWQDPGVRVADAAPRDGPASARGGRRADCCHIDAYARARASNLQRVSSPVATARAEHHLPLRRRWDQWSNRAAQAWSRDCRLYSRSTNWSPRSQQWQGMDTITMVVCTIVTAFSAIFIALNLFPKFD